MNKKLLLILPFSLFSCFSGTTQGTWNLKKDKEGIKVYSRSSEHSKIDEIKADFNVQGTLSEMAAVMLDVDDHVQWAYSTKSNALLKKTNDADLYFYTEMNSPWPLSNRDLIVHLLLSQDPASKIMTIEETEVPDYIPEKKSVVRVPFSKAVWTVTPVNKKTIKINYQIEVDPGGAVPAWVVNMFAAKCPFESFKNLRTQITLEKYHLGSPSFITNQ
ncbi:MAG: START domain-containing protein [Bacteroidota bacterium]|nr:START domain-containing protein [Bacteroidota bacterium]